MRIKSVRAIPLYVSFARIWGGADKVPASVLRPAAHFRRIPRSGQFSTIIVAEEEGGVTGTGEAFGLPYSPVTTALINNLIAPILKGRELDHPAECLADLYNYFMSMGHTRGFAMEALGGIDIALWDLKARAAGEPLAVHLGGKIEPVPLYVSPIPFLEREEESAQRARDFVTDGYRALKLKIGRTVAQDIAHTAAVRAAVGPDIQVMLDVNCSYELGEAIELARGLEGLGVAWLEEPIKPERPHDLARIREVATMPIATGENDYVLASFEELVRCDAVDILQPNITRVGVSGMMAIGEFCAKHGLALAPHGVGSGIGVAASVHACCAAKGFQIYEANRLPNPLRDDIPVHPIDIRDGFAFLSDRPGHGCEIDWERAATYEISDGDISDGAIAGGQESMNAAVAG
ncbi:hypothetical protein GC173_16805 [bacterium]|nr:hypothetical protein [bacterium]